ncbi:MAG: glycosyltransferase family 25 protein [Holosporaceae bacterium]|jgi:GR25 family glycosyltransferase involved in LPS biosynthesis|nr:glycosyltransferase family 25 protein [Holosporaceae bacterium]
MNKIFHSIFFVIVILLSDYSSQEDISEITNKKIEDVGTYDAIYIITLDRMPHRFEGMERRLKTHNLEPTKFYAVDGYEVVLVNKRTGEIISGKQKMKNVGKYRSNNKNDTYHVSYNGKYKDAEFDINLQNRTSAGEIGVTFSHRAIWADVVKNCYKRVIVFEDDAIPLNKFKKHLLNLLKNIPRDSDITFMSVGFRKDKAYYYPNIEKIFRNFDHVPNNEFVAKIQPTNRLYGMYAYIVGEKGAKKLLEISSNVNYPIDDIVFSQKGINKGKIKGYISKRKICSVSFENSEITKMGRPF